MAIANGHVCFVSPISLGLPVCQPVCVTWGILLLYCSDMDVTTSPWAVNGKAFCETHCELIIP